MKKRKIGQKISWGIAMFCYLLSLLAAAYAIYWQTDHSTDHPIFASLLASVVFLIGCGIVLHVIANTNLPNLKPDSDG